MIGTRATRRPSVAGATRRGCATAARPPARGGRRPAASPFAIVVRVVTPARSSAEVDQRHARCGPTGRRSAPRRRAAGPPPPSPAGGVATAVSTTGTPVMSRMTISEPVVDDPLQQRLVHLLGAGGVQAADDRQGQDAVPDLDDRRLQLADRLALLARWCGLRVRPASCWPLASRRSVDHSASLIVLAVAVPRSAAAGRRGSVLPSARRALDLDAPAVGRARAAAPGVRPEPEALRLQAARLRRAVELARRCAPARPAASRCRCPAPRSRPRHRRPRSAR